MASKENKTCTWIRVHYLIQANWHIYLVLEHKDGSNKETKTFDNEAITERENDVSEHSYDAYDCGAKRVYMMRMFVVLCVMSDSILTSSS